LNFGKNQRKLINPFAKRRNAGIQRRVVGIVKTSDNRRMIAEKMSIKPRMSPVGNPMIPLSKRSPEKNRIILNQGSIPNISQRNTTAANASIPPNIFTNTIKNLEDWGLIRFALTIFLIQLL